MSSCKTSGWNPTLSPRICLLGNTKTLESCYSLCAESDLDAKDRQNLIIIGCYLVTPLLNNFFCFLQNNFIKDDINSLFSLIFLSKSVAFANIKFM